MALAACENVCSVTTNEGSIVSDVGGRAKITTNRDFAFGLLPGKATTFPQAGLIPDFQATCDLSFTVFAVPTKTAIHRFTIEIGSWVRGDVLITSLGSGTTSRFYERTECRYSAGKRVCRDL
jgi:hypothetical protein